MGLQESFEKSDRPDHSERLRLSIELGRPVHSIDTWFKFARKFEENPGDEKNKGTKFTQIQIDKMESIFSENKYPKANVIKPLAVEFGREQESLREWFRRERIKFEKENNVKLTSSNKYSEEDLQFLRDEFAKNPHPSKDERIEIGEKIGRTEQGICKHFKKFRSEVRNKSSPESKKSPKWATPTL